MPVSRERMMLLSDWILSKENGGLTLETAKWVLANALSIPQEQLTNICKQADHPLLQDETLFDNVPDEAKALFVTTSLLPQKHFNRAFAWLFGKESINEIDADSFAFHENLKSKDARYSLEQKWSELPLSKDEYEHIYAVFKGISCAFRISYLGYCVRGLKEHRHLSIDAFIELEKDDDEPTLNVSVSPELADYFFDREFKGAKRKFNYKAEEGKADAFIDYMENVFTLKNLSQNKRDMVIEKFGLDNFELDQVFFIYNQNVPDHIVNQLLDLKLINSYSIRKNGSFISDPRLPIEMAKSIVYAEIGKFSEDYLRREDVDEGMRTEFLSKLANATDPYCVHSSISDMAMIGILRRGVLTANEVEIFECRKLKEYSNSLIFEWSAATGIDLPLDLQKKWIAPSQMSSIQLKTYSDIPQIIQLINERRTDHKAMRGLLGRDYEDIDKAISSLFQNKAWTGERLFELIRVCKQEPIHTNTKKILDMLCNGALCKLFSESIYPALVGHGNGDGKYGRAEPAVAYVLRDHHNMLSPCDLDLFIQSNVQFDYKDTDVDLGRVMEMYPDLNEATIAQQLKRQLGKIGDMSTRPRKSHHI